MSIMHLYEVLKRIEDAPRRSPIAVFMCSKPGYLDAVFADTVLTKAAIRRKDPKLIGVFHGRMNMSKVRRQLQDYIDD